MQGSDGVADPGGARRWPAVALAALVCGFGVWYFGGLAPYGLHVGEDGDLLYEAFAAYRGELPYIDFSTGYTPGYFYWHALLFHLFGVNALVVRVSIALANILTLVLLQRLAARFVSPALALLAPVLFLGSLPAFPGEFCSFNVPYPAWYNIPLWLGSLVAVGTYVDRGRVRSVFVAALLTGLSFSAKPNVGLFNLAALSFFLLWWHAPSQDDSRLTHRCWWGLLLATIGGVLAVFGVHVFGREFRLFPLPLLVAAAALIANARRAPGRPGFLPAARALVLGFALPTVPWLLYFLVRLGIAGFLRDVLLIGTSYQLFFFIPHRVLWTHWDLGLVAVGGAFLLTPMAIERRWLAPWVPFAVAAAALAAATAYVALLAPMREGFHSAVTSRVQDLAFFLLQAVNWFGIALVARDTTRDPHDRAALLGNLVALAVSGPAMALGMHPRSDYSHLMISAPVSMVLATILIARIFQRWREALPDAQAWRWATAALVVAPPLVVASVMAAPSIALAVRLYGHYLGLRPGELTRLDLPSASLILEPGNDRKFRSLRDVTRYVTAQTGRDDYVFPFPNLPLLCFLAERLNPTPKGYFIAGYPDHFTEAQVVDSLRRRPPRLVLSLHEHQPFVTSASLYYFLIRDFVTANFDLARRFGPYAVLHRNGEQVAAASQLDDPESPPPSADPWSALDDPNPDVQRATALQIGELRDPVGAAALARRAARGDSPDQILFLRIASQFADERAVPPLVDIVHRHLRRDPRRSSEARRASWEENAASDLAAAALYYIADKSVMEHYWLGAPSPAARFAALRAEVEPRRLRRWLRDRDADGRLRYAAAWAAAAFDDHQAIPYLLTMLGSPNFELNRAAAYALTELGQAEATADTVVSLLGHDDLFLPSVLIELHRRAPRAVTPAIARGLLEGTAKQRETLGFVVAALHEPSLLPLLDHMRDDTSERARRAASWAAETLRAPAPGPLGVDR